MLGLILALAAVPGFAQDLPGRNACREAIVWFDVTRNLIKDGSVIGTMPTRYELACNGDVVWTDVNRNIHKNERHVGVGAIEFKATRWTGDAVWTDVVGSLRINTRLLGNAVKRWEIARDSGDVIWLDVNRNIHKNERPLGVNATDFRVYDDGRVAWDDALGFRHID